MCASVVCVCVCARCSFEYIYFISVYMQYLLFFPPPEIHGTKRHEIRHREKKRKKPLTKPKKKATERKEASKMPQRNRHRRRRRHTNQARARASPWTIWLSTWAHLNVASFSSASVPFLHRTELLKCAAQTDELNGKRRTSSLQQQRACEAHVTKTTAHQKLDVFWTCGSAQSIRCRINDLAANVELNEQ